VRLWGVMTKGKGFILSRIGGNYGVEIWLKALHCMGTASVLSSGNNLHRTMVLKYG